MIDYVINTSLAEHKVITIIYQKDSLITKRDIKVTGIRDGIVEAYCYMRHRPRNFKRENILAALPQKSNYSINN